MVTNKKLYYVNKTNADIIDKYLEFKIIQKPEISHRSLRNIKETLKKLSDFLKEKPLKNATEKDLQDFFKSISNEHYTSRDTYANHIIPFYRWEKKLNKKERPQNMLWYEFTTKREKERKKDPYFKEKYLITTEEYEKMLNYNHDIYNQSNAILETYYLSGIRPEELTGDYTSNEKIPENFKVSMLIEDFIEKNGRYSIRIHHSKTKPRQVPLPKRPDNLIRYIGNHPHKDNKKAPLWFSLKDPNKLKPLKIDSLRFRFRKIKNSLNLKPTLSLKCFRKTRATFYFKQAKNSNINYRDIGKIFGWNSKTVLERAEEYDLSNFDDLIEKLCPEPSIPISFDTLEKEKKELKNFNEKILNVLKEKNQKQEKTIRNQKGEIQWLKRHNKLLNEKFSNLENKLDRISIALDNTIHPTLNGEKNPY